MLLRTSHFSLFVAILAGTGLLAGCSQSLESNPTFQEHVARVEKMEESLNDTRNRLVLLDNEFQTVSKDVNTLVANGQSAAASPQALQALGERVANMERTLRGVNETLVVLNQKGAAGHAPARAVAATAASSDADVAADNAPGADNKAASPVRKTQASVRKRASGTVAVAQHERPRGTGRYHLVRSGETLEKIADQYRTSPRRILDANKIPAGRPIVAGQQIYVPTT